MFNSRLVRTSSGASRSFVGGVSQQLVAPTPMRQSPLLSSAASSPPSFSPSPLGTCFSPGSSFPKENAFSTLSEVIPTSTSSSTSLSSSFPSFSSTLSTSLSSSCVATSSPSSSSTASSTASSSSFAPASCSFGTSVSSFFPSKGPSLLSSMINRSAHTLAFGPVMSESPELVMETVVEQPPIQNQPAEEADLQVPKKVVQELDRYIVGQNEAKKAVAIALRNRWRRQKLNESVRDEVIPKNILMIGPTGVGKTEIARRLAKLANAPFIKVEATKFTEIGFHGRDVDMIIRDLLDVAINMVKADNRKKHKGVLDRLVEDRILDALLMKDMEPATREKFRQHLRDGLLETQKIEIEVPIKESDPPQQGQRGGGLTDGSPLNLPMLRGMLGSKRTERRSVTVADSRPLLEDAEVEKQYSNEEIAKQAIHAVEQGGIVFIDEIDKICTSSTARQGADASADGVQRDLLPIIEGSTVSTKHGNVKTDHILFIASGAFHAVKPSDMLAELQGRLPIRVELKGLTEQDMYRILTEPDFNLVKQQVALMATEDVQLVFEDDAIRTVARIATEVNRSLENIGARRLHTIIERTMEDLSFEASERKGELVKVTADMVEKKVGDLLKKNDLSKFVL